MTESLSALFGSIYTWIGGAAIAAILVLSWALRGAPIGQASEDETDEEAPGVSYRNRVVAAAVAGLLTIGAGAVVASVHGVPWSIPLFALGFGIVLVLVHINKRYRHASPTLRRVVQVSDAALTTSLLAGVLLVGNVLAFRYGGRTIDMTRERAYSLESQTVGQLKSLQRPVRFTVFFGDSPVANQQRTRVSQLLELYKAENPGRIKVETINPYEQRVDFEDLLKRVPDLSVARGGGVVIEYGEGETAQHLVLRNLDLFEPISPGAARQNPDRFESVFHGEEALTSALIRLREQKKQKIAILSGHGESPANQSETSKQGIGQVRSRLAAVGVEAVELNLIQRPIEPGTALVLIAGPTGALQPREIERLDAYMAAGGRLLVLIDNRNKTGLDDLLKSYNVEVGPGLILDRVNNDGRSASIIFTVVSGELHHPVVDSLTDLLIALPNSVPIAAGQGNPKFEATPILRTSRDSWVETDLSKPPSPRGKARGPHTVAVAVAERDKPGGGEGKPRLVVIGSRYVADNFFVERNAANLDFILNAVNWLRERPEQRGITPKKHTALTLTADPNLRARLVLVPTLLSFAAIVGLGLTTYLARRA